MPSKKFNLNSKVKPPPFSPFRIAQLTQLSKDHKCSARSVLHGQYPVCLHADQHPSGEAQRAAAPRGRWGADQLAQRDAAAARAAGEAGGGRGGEAAGGEGRGEGCADSGGDAGGEESEGEEGTVMVIVIVVVIVIAGNGVEWRITNNWKLPIR